jgi:adenosylcobinamide-phosphate synthase
VSVATAAVVIAYAADAAVGEFPGRVHPVAAFGRLVGLVDREWRHPQAVGVAAAALLPLVAAGACWVVVAAAKAAGSASGEVAVAAAEAVGSAFGEVALAAGGAVDGGIVTGVTTALAAGIVLFATTSVRMLVSVGRQVIDASETDTAAARDRVRALVGRETDDLDAAELRSAAVESLAENLADGLVAPLSAFALGAQLSPAVGAGAAGWVKAVNTMDSMLGYRSKPVGQASARLDDAVVWLPARLTAGLLAVAGGRPRAVVTARRWAAEPASPNSGWPMATLAVVLGVRLRKPGAYDLAPASPLPTPAAARRGVLVVTVAAGLAGLLAGVVVWS